MNQYETVFILTPVLSDVQMKEAVENFKGILTEMCIRDSSSSYQNDTVQPVGNVGQDKAIGSDGKQYRCSTCLDYRLGIRHRCG